MKVLSTKIHGILDYITAIFLILCPQLFDLSNSSSEGAVFVILGILTLVYSAITQYELGLFRVMPMDAHLVFDIFSGIFLAASPWLLDFSRYTYLPHVIIGFAEVAIAFMTRSRGMLPL
ncbi:SPW repeat domain-containing protein [Sphingobacterium athyrii]|uniref:SPW repeat-containing integral membrane domain-containing protein n=1 Tax=Sphingobacterium athyrii TaxID=2152717 RepID=A0A363NWQ8_9SPHI|nr:hypothetical protein [Sphingobacterium athyrii]PUV25180.1 hypothetical protein DCO56_09590 [Sphingobacterium athyrii]